MSAFRIRKYWQLERFAQYASTLVDYYSRRTDYTTRLTTSIGTAAVIPSRKQVLINPEWKRTRKENLARVQVSGHDRLTLTIDGLAAHEAAHIRFSGDWPGGLLGQLVNALEDERIERLQAKDFPLQRAFDFLGDCTLLADVQSGAFFTARAGVLLWRFQHDFPHDVWHTDEESWDEVRPLVERAWEALNTDEVIAIAREIIDVLGLDEDEPADPLLAALRMHGEGEAAPEAPSPPPDGTGTHKPTTPQDDTEAFADLEKRITLARPLASQLEGILKTPRQEQKVLSRSRGRLTVRRVIRGEERPFEQKPVLQELARRVLMVQDISGSMGAFVPEYAHYHALLTAVALELACASTRTPFALLSFDDVATLERPYGPATQETLLKVASLESRGMTELSVALELAAQDTRAEDLIFILCDGALLEADALKSRMLTRRLKGTVVPILIGQNTKPEQFQAVFGRCYKAERAEEIPALIKRSLLAQQAGVL